MLLGRIIGKVTTREFKFKVEHETLNFEYVKVYHAAYEWVLCQVVELEATTGGTTATCIIIGFHDGKRVKQVRIPFELGTEVLRADDDFIKLLISIPEHGAYLGKLEGRDIKVSLDLQKLLTKHVAVLAKSGAGKSYAVGVLVEEILEKGVPVVIIDPHGEHGTLKKPAVINDQEKKRMAKFGLKPKGYEVIEFGDPKLGLNPLKLSNKLSRTELVHILPKLNTTR
ncbi:unnamed protein product, partial [marine sediment metagenome]